jgi:hypothetical protein
MSAMTDAISTATTTRSRPIVSSTSNLRAGQDPLSLPKGTTAAPAYARLARAPEARSVVRRLDSLDRRVEIEPVEISDGR